MRDVTVELKELRLHGMASAWDDLIAQGTLASLESSRWLIEHLLRAETSERVMRSVSYQMNAAKFPVHRDLAGFDFTSSKVERSLVEQLAELSFTDVRTTPSSLVDRAPARRIWPPPSASPALPSTESGCASTRRWIWSMHWNVKRSKARPDASP
jgi:hypothetical protein